MRGATYFTLPLMTDSYARDAPGHAPNKRKQVADAAASFVSDFHTTIPSMSEHMGPVLLLYHIGLYGRLFFFTPGVRAEMRRCSTSRCPSPHEDGRAITGMTPAL